MECSNSNSTYCYSYIFGNYMDYLMKSLCSLGHIHIPSLVAFHQLLSDLLYIYMLTILKVFIEFVKVLFLFFGYEACGILAPTPGIKPTPPALEGEVNQWTTKEVPLVN